jgi:predicted MFS family arabinose efflux permease
VIPIFIILLRSSTKPAEKKAPKKKVKFTLRSRGVITQFCFISLMASVGGGVLFNLFPYYVNMKFGVQSAALGVLYFISNFVQAGANISAARVARMMGAVRTIVVSIGLSALFYLMIPLSSSFELLFIFYIIRFGLSNLASPLLSSLFMKLVDDDERSTANSAANVSTMGGNIVASSLGGQLMGRISLDFPAYLGSGICMVEAAVFHLVFRNREKFVTVAEVAED